MEVITGICSFYTREMLTNITPELHTPKCVGEIILGFCMCTVTSKYC